MPIPFHEYDGSPKLPNWPSSTPPRRRALRLLRFRFDKLILLMGIVASILGSAGVGVYVVFDSLRYDTVFNALAQGAAMFVLLGVFSCLCVGGLYAFLAMIFELILGVEV